MARSNSILLTGRLSDAAAMTDPDDAGTHPERLQTQQPGDRWGGGIAPRVHVDFGTATAIDCVALIDHDGSADAELTLTAADSEGGLDSAPPFEATYPLFPDGKPATAWPSLSTLIYLPAGLFTRRWARLAIDDPDAPGGEFTAGRLLMGIVLRPIRNHDFGWSTRWLDPTTRKAGLGGQGWPGRRRLKHRLVDFGYRFGTEADRAGFDDLQLEVGMSGDVFGCLDPETTTDRHRTMVYGLFADLDPLINARVKIFETRFQIEELTR